MRGCQRAHGVKQVGQRPVFRFATTGKYDILLAQLNQFNSIANTVRAGCAGG